MTITTKVQPLYEDIRIVISDLLTPEAQSAAFADFAAQALLDAEATDTSVLGYTPTHTTFVDGTETEDLSRVRPIRARAVPANGIVALVSRTHRDAKTEEYLASYKIAEFNAAGSSLKFGLIAAGEADLYPRHGPTSEWDTAAGQAVLEAAGGSVTTLDGAPLTFVTKSGGFGDRDALVRISHALRIS